MNRFRRLSIAHEEGLEPPPDLIHDGNASRIRRPQSPALPIEYTFDRDFCSSLNRKLELLLVTQQLRRRLYGPEDAEVWPISHTPPEVKQRYMTGREEAMREMDAPTPEEEEFEMPVNRISASYAGLHIQLDPPSPDSPTESPWMTLHHRLKKSAQSHVQTPHTPPSSSEDDDVAKASSAKHNHTKKRPLARVGDSCSDSHLRRQRMRVFPPDRASMRVG